MEEIARECPGHSRSVRLRRACVVAAIESGNDTPSAIVEVFAEQGFEPVSRPTLAHDKKVLGSFLHIRRERRAAVEKLQPGAARRAVERAESVLDDSVFAKQIDPRLTVKFVTEKLVNALDDDRPSPALLRLAAEVTGLVGKEDAQNALRVQVNVANILEPPRVRLERPVERPAVARPETCSIDGRAIEATPE